jgi:MFS family permease
VITYGAFLNYLPFLLANSFAASPFVIGLVILTMYFTSAVTSSQLGKLAKKVPERRLLKIALILYAPALFFIPYATSIWVIILPVAILGIAWGISIPVVYAILGELAPEECRAAFISMDEMSVRVGQTLGPLLMFFAFSVWGVIGVFYVGVVVSIIMFASTAVMVR